MCGRFYFSDQIDVTTYEKILYDQYGDELYSLWTRGEKFPGTVNMIIDNRAKPKLMLWQYKLFDRNLINTRIESIREKNYYREDFRNHRCLVIASGFYEWSQDKKRYYIHAEKEPVFLAAIYQESASMPCFSILTRPATKSASIHHRAPFIFDKYQAVDYLNNGSITEMMKADPQIIIEKS